MDPSSPFKCLAILLMLASATALGKSASPLEEMNDLGDTLNQCHSADCFDIVTDLMMDSEINRRVLKQNTRFISYDALKANRVPCSRRGRSYYDCNSRQKANPYVRGCSAITHCKRFTD
ncbi:hypothetical protein K2173_004419 [Erythroxylum novogranatense]|uniref:Uncharacterized protein n=1 Tax=Erythroxylum novogranatense TaxID=1862640 RepID=A0AAV8T5Y8_9ROSI|nr:hypothetical protein K2173_004419 [Erythroxylum novogranatense]